MIHSAAKWTFMYVCDVDFVRIFHSVAKCNPNTGSGWWQLRNIFGAFRLTIGNPQSSLAFYFQFKIYCSTHFKVHWAFPVVSRAPESWYYFLKYKLPANFESIICMLSSGDAPVSVHSKYRFAPKPRGLNRETSTLIVILLACLTFFLKFFVNESSHV